MIRTFVLAAALAVTASAFAAPGTPIELSDVRQNLFATCFTSDRDGWIVGEERLEVHDVRPSHVA